MSFSTIESTCQRGITLPTDHTTRDSGRSCSQNAICTSGVEIHFRFCYTLLQGNKWSSRLSWSPACTALSCIMPMVTTGNQRQLFACSCRQLGKYQRNGAGSHETLNGGSRRGWQQAEIFFLSLTVYEK